MMVTVETQYCSTCGLLKSLHEFHRDPKGMSGRQASCRECRNAKAREARAMQTEEQRAAEAERGRTRRAHTRSLNWERVQHLLIEALLGFPLSAQAQDIGKQILDMAAGVASKPLPRGGAPAAWDAVIDIRSAIRDTEGAALAVEHALACERLDVILHVLIPQAEASLAWAMRQRVPKTERKAATQKLNAAHAEARVLGRRIEAIRKLASYDRAMGYLARRLYAMGVR